MKYARIDWSKTPPVAQSFHEYDTPPVDIKLEDGKPVLIPVSEQAQPVYDTLTQRLERTVTISALAYTITYKVIALTDAEIEAIALAEESVIDGGLVNSLLRQQIIPADIPPAEIEDFVSLFPVWRFNAEPYVIGDIVQYDDMVFKCLQAHNSQSDWSPPIVPALWVRLAEPGSVEWLAGVAYAVADEVTYNGTLYRCLQAHTSQIGWEPPNVPALWSVV